jgi:hypothetical protein
MNENSFPHTLTSLMRGFSEKLQALRYWFQLSRVMEDCS